MGNGSCCRYRSERTDTLVLDDDQKPDHNMKQSRVEGQLICISDSEDECDDLPKRQSQFGKFKDQTKKGSQLSTGQQYSFQSLPSEQQFSNFVTFQALPSGHNIQNNHFAKLQQNFSQEMQEVAKFQQQSQKNIKKVHFSQH